MPIIGFRYLHTVVFCATYCHGSLSIACTLGDVSSCNTLLLHLFMNRYP